MNFYEYALKTQLKLYQERHFDIVDQIYSYRNSEYFEPIDIELLEERKTYFEEMILSLNEKLKGVSK